MQAGPFLLPRALPPSQASSATMSDRKGTNFHLPAHAERNRSRLQEPASVSLIPALHIVLAGDGEGEAEMEHCLQFKCLDLRKNQ